MPKTIAELAPTLMIASTAEEIKSTCASSEKQAVETGTFFEPQPKRIREAMMLLAAHPEMTDSQVMKRVASVRSEHLSKIRDEIAAVKANPDALVKADVKEELLEEPKKDTP